jgi:DNA-binding IclR family transcriptional regulator
MMKSTLIVVAVLSLALTGCSKFHNSAVGQVVVKDVPLEEQEHLLDEYVGRTAWTRTTLEDLTDR